MLLNVDSGPGQMNYKKVLAKMQARGFYLYPCVPNTAAAVT